MIIKAFEPKSTNQPFTDFNSDWFDTGKKVGLKEGYDVGHKDGYEQGFRDATNKVIDFCNDIEER